MTKKMVDNRHGEGHQEDEHPRLVKEDSRSTGQEEDCAGGHGPYWTVGSD
jgi:hypothetical protein